MILPKLHTHNRILCFLQTRHNYFQNLGTNNYEFNSHKLLVSYHISLNKSNSFSLIALFIPTSVNSLFYREYKLIHLRLQRFQIVQGINYHNVEWQNNQKFFHTGIYFQMQDKNWYHDRNQHWGRLFLIL